MNWRPIKTAPKDDVILLCYPSFADDSLNIVCQGQWVDLPRTDHVKAVLQSSGDPSTVQHVVGWMVSYITEVQHGGTWHGKSIKTSSVFVQPTHWQPLPKPRKQP